MKRLLLGLVCSIVFLASTASAQTLSVVPHPRNPNLFFRIQVNPNAADFILGVQPVALADCVKFGIPQITGTKIAVDQFIAQYAARGWVWASWEDSNRWMQTILWQQNAYNLGLLLNGVAVANPLPITGALPVNLPIPGGGIQLAVQVGGWVGKVAAAPAPPIGIGQSAAPLGPNKYDQVNQSNSSVVLANFFPGAMQAQMAVPFINAVTVSAFTNSAAGVPAAPGPVTGTLNVGPVNTSWICKNYL